MKITGRSFVHLARAWYGAENLRGNDGRPRRDGLVDEVSISIDTDGPKFHSNFEIPIGFWRFDDGHITAKLSVFADQFEALPLLGDLLQLLAALGPRVTPDQLCDALAVSGYKNETPAKRI